MRRKTGKSVISMVLAAALMLSLAACGGSKSMTQEEMLEIAENLDNNTVVDAFLENKVRAEQTYIDNIYKITEFVTSIETDYCQLASFRIYFNENEDVLATLNKGEKITVVGKLTNLGSETTAYGPGSKTAYAFDLTDAYFVENIYEITGVVKINNTRKEYYDENGRIASSGSVNDWYYYIEDSAGDKYRFEDGVVSELKDYGAIMLGEQVKSGDSLTFSGKTVIDEQDVDPSQFIQDVKYLVTEAALMK